MTDFMRDAIAQLMGSHKESEDGRKLPPFDDSAKVCRPFLLGCCPREILTDTRLENVFICRKLHEKAHIADFERAQSNGKDYFFDLEAFLALEECIKAVDYEVQKVGDKIKKDSESDLHDFIKSHRISELNDKIAVTVNQMQELGTNGHVTESIEMSRTVSELQRKKMDLENELRNGQSVQQRLRVCLDCSAQLNVLDHESRLADHYGGKMHLGMVTIREKYEEMKKTIDERRAAKREYEDKYRSERGDRDRRRRSRSRSKSPGRKRHRRSRTRSRSPRSSRSRYSERRRH